MKRIITSSILLLFIGVSVLSAVPIVYPKDIEVEPINVTVYPIKESGGVEQHQDDRPNSNEPSSTSTESDNSTKKEGGGAFGYLLPLLALLLLFRKRVV